MILDQAKNETQEVLTKSVNADRFKSDAYAVILHKNIAM
jgi:hypothetical protein